MKVSSLLLLGATFCQATKKSSTLAPSDSEVFKNMHTNTSAWDTRSCPSFGISKMAFWVAENSDRGTVHDQMYETQSTASFVNEIYTNAFHRNADFEGLLHWTNAIDNGTLTRAVAYSAIVAAAQANTTPQGLMDAAISSTSPVRDIN